MSVLNIQQATIPSQTDQPYFNYGVSDLAAGIAVAVDNGNDLSANPKGVGVKLPAADGDPVIGVTMEIIKASSYGRVRGIGPTVAMVAKGAITAGTWVMAEGTTGNAKAASTGKSALGVALNATTSDGDELIVMITSGYNG